MERTRVDQFRSTAVDTNLNGGQRDVSNDSRMAPVPGHYPSPRQQTVSRGNGLAEHQGSGTRPVVPNPQLQKHAGQAAPKVRDVLPGGAVNKAYVRDEPPPNRQPPPSDKKYYPADLRHTGADATKRPNQEPASNHKTGYTSSSSDYNSRTNGSGPIHSRPKNFHNPSITSRPVPNSNSPTEHYSARAQFESTQRSNGLPYANVEPNRADHVNHYASPNPSKNLPYNPTMDTSPGTNRKDYITKPVTSSSVPYAGNSRGYPKSSDLSHQSKSPNTMPYPLPVEKLSELPHRSEIHPVPPGGDDKQYRQGNHQREEPKAYDVPPSSSKPPSSYLPAAQNDTQTRDLPHHNSSNSKGISLNHRQPQPTQKSSNGRDSSKPLPQNTAYPPDVYPSKHPTSSNHPTARYQQGSQKSYYSNPIQNAPGDHRQPASPPSSRGHADVVADSRILPDDINTQRSADTSHPAAGQHYAKYKPQAPHQPKYQAPTPQFTPSASRVPSDQSPSASRVPSDQSRLPTQHPHDARTQGASTSNLSGSGLSALPRGMNIQGANLAGPYSSGDYKEVTVSRPTSATPARAQSLTDIRLESSMIEIVPESETQPVKNAEGPTKKRLFKKKSAKSGGTPRPKSQNEFPYLSKFKKEWGNMKQEYSGVLGRGKRSMSMSALNDIGKDDEGASTKEQDTSFSDTTRPNFRQQPRQGPGLNSGEPRPAGSVPTSAQRGTNLYRATSVPGLMQGAPLQLAGASPNSSAQNGPRVNNANNLSSSRSASQSNLSPSAIGSLQRAQSLTSLAAVYTSADRSLSFKLMQEERVVSSGKAPKDHLHTMIMSVAATVVCFPFGIPLLLCTIRNKDRWVANFPKASSRNTTLFFAGVTTIILGFIIWIAVIFGVSFGTAT